MPLSCFKAYDVRGKVPEELDEALAYRIGRALAQALKPGAVVVGRDVRLSSPAIAKSLSVGLIDSGMDVLDIGLCGTEQVYFSTAHLKASGGVMVTASHNPKGYNGMKFVREESKPISGDTGLREIEALAERGEFKDSARRGETKAVDTTETYIDHLLSYIEPSSLPPFKVLVNPGNGCAGPVIDMIEGRLGSPLPGLRPSLSHWGGEGNKVVSIESRGIKFVKIFNEPDGDFPHGIPNPLLPENRDATAKAVKDSGADIGVAWDGDFDRCFLFDENGKFIEGYYIVGLLAEAMLAKHPGAKIIHDPRLTWNTIDIVKSSGGIPIMSKTGHAFIKERMRAEDAVYGGEMSAHHYFRDFAYCDSGMVPWLLVLSVMAKKGKKLSELVEEREKLYPVSGEINREIADPAAALKKVEEKYSPAAISIDHTDGVSIEFPDWRFNLRMSNTEPLVRLNVEARRDKKLMEQKTAELLNFLDEVK